MALVFRHPESDYTPQPDKESAVPDSQQTMQLASGARYHPTVWNTPADLAAYDAALQASTQQIENSFGGVLLQGQDAGE